MVISKLYLSGIEIVEAKQRALEDHVTLNCTLVELKYYKVRGMHMEGYP